MKFKKTILYIPAKPEDAQKFYEGNRDIDLIEYDGLAIGDFHIRKHISKSRLVNNPMPSGYVVSSISIGAIVRAGIDSHSEAKQIAKHLYETVNCDPFDWKVLHGLVINNDYVDACKQALIEHDSSK